MEATTRPLFALYIVWHPSNAGGAQVAKLLHGYFGRDRHQNIAGDVGLSVLYRSEILRDGVAPLAIDWDEAETTAVVVLVDSALAGDSAWSDYVRDLSRNAQSRGRLLTRLFPVVMDAGGRELQLEEQALLWDRWEESNEEKGRRLVSELTYEFSRMLRHRLRLLRQPGAADVPFSAYLEKIQVFLSHTKRDDDGEPIARSIRNWLHENIALSSFFDVFDIPAGLSFREVLLHEVETGAVVVVHTDAYSSREWCRREVIEAKRRHVPMVVVDCLRDLDQRSVPYMGNVPVVRMSPDRQDRLNTVIGCLLDEIFRTYLWRCRVEPFREAYPNVLFTARPSELLLLATLPVQQREASSAIVYPEPLLGADEARLFSEIAPDVPVVTLTEWMEANQ